MALTFDDVSEILKIIDASDCEELILELDGARLVVRRRGANGAGAVTASPSADGPARSSTPVAETPNADIASRRSPDAGGAAVVASHHVQVRAPMVGTFYRRPSPAEPPFVEVGKHVNKGDPLCLIEVMKLFTTIEAPGDGTIETICAADGTLVEFDQILFVIAPD